jgi:protein transport protein SEC61 subunit gamma and related proteins
MLECKGGWDDNMDAETTKASEYQEKVESKFRNLGKGKYGRILKMARTPTNEEYKKTVAITGAGIIIIGALGFVIMWLMTYLPTYF